MGISVSVSVFVPVFASVAPYPFSNSNSPDYNYNYMITENGTTKNTSKITIWMSRVQETQIKGRAVDRGSQLTLFLTSKVR
jgi:hypothetical protein